MTDTRTTPGPLLLGTSGRVGRALRAVADAGLWPGPRPLFHARCGGDVTFDLLGPVPDLPAVRGVVILAGVTTGTPEQLALNTALADAGLALARDRGLGRALVISSAGVYGRRDDPCAEDDALHPGTPYGRAKRDMETAVAAPGVTCLRLANVAGCDALFAAAARGPVRLDRFPDGTGPSRVWIGPVTLARVLVALLAHPGPLPPILNVSMPNPLTMAQVLDAIPHPYHHEPAPDGALHRLALDTSRLAALLPLPPVTAAALVAEARTGGWSPATP
jgi:nucleoside-diphosphate-sugar epimerase